VSAAVPTKEPTEHQAGNSLVWDKTVDDYPATLWTLTYYIRGSIVGGFTQSIVASADGDGYSVSVTAATTSIWVAGDYWLIGYVSNATERFEVYRGNLKILADATQETNFDGRTYNQRCLDAINRMIEEGMIRETVRYSYNGVSHEVRTFEDAFKAKAYFEEKVANEQGAGHSRKIYTRFRSPR
jgi:hypothetical protein